MAGPNLMLVHDFSQRARRNRTKVLTSTRAATLPVGPVDCARIGKRSIEPGAHLLREGGLVSDRSETPFDSIESSHEYVALLAEAIEEARRDVDVEIELALHEGAARRKQALQLVSYNLAKLSLHMTTSRRI